MLQQDCSSSTSNLVSKTALPPPGNARLQNVSWTFDAADAESESGFAPFVIIVLYGGCSCVSRDLV